MALKNKPTKLIILTIILIILELIVILDSQLYIGELINYSFPCKQNEANSFPCYGIYSIYLFISNLVLILGLIGYLTELYISRNDIWQNTYSKMRNMLGYALLVGLIMFVCWMIFGFLFLR